MIPISGQMAYFVFPICGLRVKRAMVSTRNSKRCSAAASSIINKARRRIRLMAQYPVGERSCFFILSVSFLSSLVGVSASADSCRFGCRNQEVLWTLMTRFNASGSDGDITTASDVSNSLETLIKYQNMNEVDVTSLLLTEWDESTPSSMSCVICAFLQRQNRNTLNKKCWFSLFKNLHAREYASTRVRLRDTGLRHLPEEDLRNSSWKRFRNIIALESYCDAPGKRCF